MTSVLVLRRSVAALLPLVLMLLAHTGSGQPVLAPDSGTGLFSVNEDSAPLVEAQYVGWGAKWKWDQPEVKVGQSRGAATPFTLRFRNLDVDATGAWQTVGRNRASWTFDFSFNRDRSDVIGGGIEFALKLDSPVRQGAQILPTLVSGNRGWEWEYKPGETIRILFDPGVANVYFERGQKHRIRAMFFAGDLKRGTSRLSMTVGLPAGGRVARSLAERYGPADSDTWLEQAIAPDHAFVDLSHLNEKPAGRHGFVKAVGDHFEFEDGNPVAFWGCNVQAYSLFVKDREQIKRHAQRIAKLGFNLVRLHHHDSAEWVQPCLIAESSTSQQLNEEALDAYFWWIKCLKDEGIYIWVDLLVGRPFREGDQIPGWPDLAKHTRKHGAEAKGFNYLNERVRELLKRFNEEFLTRPNPHTGLALKDEPAVMGMLITNENDLTHHFGNLFLGDKGHPYHQKLFEVKRDAFARQYGLDRDKTGQTWVPGPSKLLLNDLEAEFNRDFMRHLRSLGVRVPVATCHMWGNTPLFSLPALTVGEIIDSHSYSHGEFLRSNPHYVPSFIHWIGHSHVVGKPFAITEYNMEDNMALDDAFTVPLTMGAMAAFQGWDAPMLYGYSQDGLGGTATSAWSSYMHPAIMGLMPAAAVMFRQGHVQLARKTVVLAPSSSDLFNAAHTPKTSAAIRTTLEQHRLVVAMPATRELPWLTPSLRESGVTTVTDLNQDLLAPGQRFIESDTGEIRRDWEKGIQTINTPKSQAAIGWLKGQTVTLADATFCLDTAKAAIVLTSLDSEPLRSSQRILLSTAARVRKQKVEWRRFYRSEPVTGTLTLTSSVSGLRLVALKADGTHGATTSLRAEDGVYTVNLLPTAGTHWFLITR